MHTRKQRAYRNSLPAADESTKVRKHERKGPGRGQIFYVRACLSRPVINQVGEVGNYSQHEIILKAA